MMKRHSYITNTKWLMIEKIIRLTLSFIVSIWIANYLGAAQFGLLNYALSFALMLSALMSLGLDKYIPKEILLNSENEDKILATSLHMRLIGGIVMVVIINTISYLFQGDDRTFLIIVGIISVGYIFRSVDILRYWFEAKVISIYSLIAQSSALFGATLLKIIFILTNAPVEYFALAITLEYILQAIILSYLFMKFKDFKPFYKFSFQEMKIMFSNTWTLLLASFLHDIYSKVDVVMLGKMISNESVGLYVAATKISLGWLFIPIVIATSFFPALLNEKKLGNTKIYYQRIQYLLNLMVFVSIFVAIILSVFSQEIINLIYTNDYKMSATILMIHIWGTIFITMSTIVNRVLIAENLNRYLLYRALVGFFVNIILNILLIPEFGAVGAATATVVSLCIALFLFNIVNIETRILFKMQVKALNPMNILLTLKALKEMK